MADSRVMLMYPNFKWANWMERTLWLLHPYNLCLLAATIKDGHDVRIVDGALEDISREQFSEVIERDKPDILGISVLTNEYGAAASVAAQIAKQTRPEVKTVVGGVHATSLPEQVIRDPNVDYVVVGEGEYVFKELCDYLKKGGEPPKKGVTYKKNGKVVDTGRADFIADLDALPFPSYSHVDFNKYARTIPRESVDGPRDLPFAHTMTSRGCPYKCNFCEVGTISGKKVRLRSVENVCSELEWLIRDYGIKALMFDDDNLLFNKQRAKNLFRAMTERKFNLKWNAPALALYKLDEEMIELMKESGCQFVDVAIESGVERVLKDIIHKPLNLEHGKRMLRKLKEVGIDTVANFIVGFPGESWDEIRQSLAFAEEIDVDYVKIAIATPLPNTELYRAARDGNYLLPNFSFDRHLWTDGWIKTDEFRPQDLKVLRAYEWDRINFTDPTKREKIAAMMGISKERLDEIRKKTLMRAVQ